MSELHYQLQHPANLWSQHPVLVQLLGLSPLLGATNNLQASVALALGTLLVICGSAAVISLLRERISANWRFPIYLAVTSMLTTLLSQLLALLNQDLHSSLGIYLPLIGCNYLVLIELERSAYRQLPLQALRSAALCGCGFALFLVVFCGIRLLSAQALGALPQPSLEDLAFSPGFALILLGLIIAVAQFLRDNLAITPDAEVKRARRVRTTGHVR